MFNNALLVTGSSIYVLNYSGGSSGYDVESNLVSTYGVNSGIGVTVILNVTGNADAASASGYAIDANSMGSGAQLIINISSSVLVRAVGGAGGKGGGVSFDIAYLPIPDGIVGGNGGDAIRLGCNTITRGSGTIVAGRGGGGGGGVALGGFDPVSKGYAGSGGGGGYPSGAAGAKGDNTVSGGTDGNVGNAASTTANGAGGAKATDGGKGGNGGGITGGSGSGIYTNTSGETGGSEGHTVVKQGFTLTKEGSVTYDGTEDV